ncbi:MAG: hypothetical protein ABSF83_11355 [Nitrososphaerales archaeon]|jgi:hypothetical protein
MSIESLLRRDLRVVIIASLAVLSLGFAGPMEGAIGMIDSGSAAPTGVVNPTMTADGVFLFCLELVFLSFVVYLGYVVVAADRKLKA